MRKCYLLLVVLCSMLKGYSQAAPDFHAWIYFADKPAVAAALANPTTILTQKALDRKARHNVAIDTRDVPMNQGYVQQVQAQTGVTYIAQSKWFNCVLVKGQPAAIDALIALSFVTLIDYADPTKSAQASSYNKFASMTATPLNYGNATNQIVMMGLDVLHDTGITGTGMTIAVTDSGFPNVDTNPGFAQLRANGGIAGGYDFVAGDASYYGDHFHGSNVLSIMAGSESGNFEGSAPDAQYYLYRTEDAATETPAELAYWVAAAERADSLGVDVINISLGYLDFDNPAEDFTYSDMDGVTSFMSRGVNVAFEKGMVIVTSAGNSGNSATHPYIASPGDAQGAFTIGAVTASQVKSSFSSIGPTVDGRLKPDVVAQGSGTAFISTAGAVSAGNGTSYSAPLIAGGIACLMQAYPNLTPQQILDTVRQSASQASMPDNLLGYGIPNFGTAQQTLSVNSLSTPQIQLYVQQDNLIIDRAQGQSQTTTTIFNLQGQRVLEQIIEQQAVINLSALASGMYIVRFTGISGSFKIIK